MLPWKKSNLSGIPESAMYSRRFIPSGQIVLFYSGLIIPCDLAMEALSAVKLEDHEEDTRTQYLLNLLTQEVSKVRELK